ncbi:MAG: hypothetical protein R3293_12825 [Candidatus Promineifilaceae bacterium]|nr:hypothetical protein [Candidatus Promineifilaceae bacterium]
MKISFQKQPGNPALGIAFTWMMILSGESPLRTTDLFIPELFYDFLYIKEGNITIEDETKNTKLSLPTQVFKTIYTYPLKFVFSTPLILYGARFSLAFAELYWGETLEGNSFLKKNWLPDPISDLQSFDRQLINHIHENQIRNPTSLLSPALEESAWLRHFSARHRRRLYKRVFGISKKEMWSIRNVHSFLEQTCDFDAQYPRIIQHVNDEVFYDQPHLNHTFKNMTGLSPLEYFEANSILQDNLMAASYNEISIE